MTAVAQPSLTLENERPQDGPEVDALVDRAFGPGRFTKASERVREYAAFRPDLSFCAWREGRLSGVVRQWLVHVGGRKVIFLGPLAVDADQRLGGLGGQLVERACAAARDAGFAAVLLVGDEPYFSRMDFSAKAAAGVVMPGPVDQRRVLARIFDGGPPLAGTVDA